MFLGMLRVSTIILFGAACLIVAPSCYNDENEWYITPLGMLYSSLLSGLGHLGSKFERIWH
jgi:hypothetical protein